MTEADFQRRLTDYCDRLRLWWHHTPDSRRSNAGMPDLLIVNTVTGEIMFAELKAERGRLRAKQQRVIEALRRGGHRAHVWRPSDWPAAEQALREIARGGL